MNEKFPQLHYFFGSYYNQDWTVEYDTPEQVLNAFVNESAASDRKLVRQELVILLERKMEESALKNYMLRDLSCYYCYWNDWESGGSWLQHIIDKLDSQP